MKSVRQKSPAQGFTLLEVLLVMTIVGLLAGLAVLSIGALDQRRLQAEADRLRIALNQAADASLLKQQTIGWRYDEQLNSYHFLLLSLDGDWLQAEDKLFKPHLLSANARIVLEKPGISEKHNLAQERPQIVFLSSGEYTPFVIQITKNTSETAIQLEGDGFNSISYRAEDSQSNPSP